MKGFRLLIPRVCKKKALKGNERRFSGQRQNLSHVSSESEKWIPIDCNGLGVGIPSPNTKPENLLCVFVRPNWPSPTLLHPKSFIHASSHVIKIVDMKKVFSFFFLLPFSDLGFSFLPPFSVCAFCWRARPKICKYFCVNNKCVSISSPHGIVCCLSFARQGEIPSKI